MKHEIARLIIAAGCTVLMPSLGSSAFAADLAQEPGHRIEANAGAGAAVPASCTIRLETSPSA
jgi:predicted flavoprotein YhiN